MKQLRALFVCLLLLAVLSSGFFGCNQPVGSRTPQPPLGIAYNFMLDKDTYNKYVLTGENWVKPENPTVTVTNTGEEPLSLTTRKTGQFTDCFILTPAYIDALAPGMSFTFTVLNEIGDPGEDIYEVSVWFESPKDKGNLAKKIVLTYGGLQLDTAEFVSDAWPLQKGQTAALSTSDPGFSTGTPWFTSDNTIIKIEGNNVTALREGQAIIGFVTDRKPITVKGRKVSVYPATIPLHPQYPLEAGLLARPAGAEILPVNRAAIENTAAGSTIAFSKIGANNVISAIDPSTGKLTFDPGAVRGASGNITVQLTASRIVPEGMLITHSGSGSFTARIGTAPAPQFYSAETSHSGDAIRTCMIDVVFTEKVSADADPHAGFALTKDTGSLTITGSSVTDNRITIILDDETPVVFGDTVSISYNKAAGSVNCGGALLESFSSQPVINRLRNIVINDTRITGTFGGVRAGIINLYEDDKKQTPILSYMIPDGIRSGDLLSIIRSEEWTVDIPSSYIGKNVFAVQEFRETETAPVLVKQGLVLDLKPPAASPYLNVAPWYAKVWTPKTAPGYTPDLALDGERGATANSVSSWRVATAGTTESKGSVWLAVDIGYPVTVNAFRFFEAYGGTVGYIKGYKIEYSNDGNNWTTVIDQSNLNATINLAAGASALFGSPVSARYFRVNIVHWAREQNLGISEFELYYAHDRRALLDAVAYTETIPGTALVSDNGGNDVFSGNAWVSSEAKTALDDAISGAKAVAGQLDIANGAPDISDLQAALSGLGLARQNFVNEKQDGKLIAMPSIVPAALNVEANTQVTLRTNTTGAEIWYTTNGNVPAKNGAGSLLYSTPFAIGNAGALTVKAIAVMSGKIDSTVLEHQFNVIGTGQTYTVTFNSAGGSKVENDLAIKDGLVAKPADPVMILGTTQAILSMIDEAGLYAANIPLGAQLTGWFLGNNEWDFDNDLVTENITLTARWSAPRIATVEGNNLGQAISHVNGSNSSFILALSQNIEHAGSTTANLANGSLYITGLGNSESRISLSSNGRIFTLGANAAVTLGNNITLYGRSNGSANNAALVRMDGNINTTNLIMLNNSKVTGHITSYDPGAAIEIFNGTLTMRGGMISGNSNRNSAASGWFTGGVYIPDTATNRNGKIVMEGGSIVDNIRNLANEKQDVFLGQGGNYTLTMSGNATIGTAVIGGRSTAATLNACSIIIAGPWSGSIASFNGRGTFEDYNDVFVRAGAGYILTQADLNKMQNGVPFDKVLLLREDANAGVLTQPPAISPENATYDLYPQALGNRGNIQVSLALNGNILRNIRSGGAVLVPGRDYTVMGNNVTLLMPYLDTLAKGNASITFEFINHTRDLSVWVINAGPLFSGLMDELSKAEELLAVTEVPINGIGNLAPGGYWVTEDVSALYQAAVTTARNVVITATDANVIAEATSTIAAART
ncbi:MAG: discoidin domain-containing protein, partial [Treponema sp.]|nr:discoidin domain-containing protein [Treponema sp.]